MHPARPEKYMKKCIPEKYTKHIIRATEKGSIDREVLIIWTPLMIVFHDGWV